LTTTVYIPSLLRDATRVALTLSGIDFAGGILLRGYLGIAGFVMIEVKVERCCTTFFEKRWLYSLSLICFISNPSFISLLFLVSPFFIIRPFLQTRLNYEETLRTSFYILLFSKTVSVIHVFVKNHEQKNSPNKKDRLPGA